MTTRAEAPTRADPFIGRILDFLAKDIATHPERVKAVDSAFVERLRARIKDVEVELDAALSGEDE